MEIFGLSCLQGNVTSQVLVICIPLIATYQANYLCLCYNCYMYLCMYMCMYSYVICLFVHMCTYLYVCICVLTCHSYIVLSQTGSTSVACHSNHNLMQASNFGVVSGPTLIQPEV